MKIIVDTNLIFSALLNSNGKVGDLLINSDRFFRFYSCSYMRFEIEKHWHKLLKMSKLTESELRESQFRLYKKLHFIDEELIAAEVWGYAEKVVGNIDIDDVNFIALCKYLNGYLWTSDKELYNGLKAKKYLKVYTTQELFDLRESKRKK